MEYVELHCKSNFTFLEGASHAEELVEQAASLGYRGLAITDTNSLSGVVRGYTVAKEVDIQYIVGAEIVPEDGPPLVMWPTDRPAYGRLCQLITLGRSRREKGECEIYWSDILQHGEGLIAGMILKQPQDGLIKPEPMALATGFGGATISQAAREASPYGSGEIPFSSSRSQDSLPPVRFDPSDDTIWIRWLNAFREAFGDRAYLLSHLHLGVDDRLKLARQSRLAQASRVPLVAAGDVLYHSPERMLLHDLLKAIKHTSTVEEIVALRPSNAQHALRSRSTIAKLYHEHPDAIAKTMEIASRCQFSLEQLKYEYPIESTPNGKTPLEYLKRLTWNGALARYPNGVPDRIVDLLKHEIRLIGDLKYEAYFLTVWDLVRFARSRGILCQGRGSAANSTVCFCLGVTSVDPNEMDLLFERFISRERDEAPDIDVDFEHERREEVLQYIYEKYGRQRAGMTAAVITYRIRSAVRDTGKALGISLDRIDALSKILEGRGGNESLSERCLQAGIDPMSDIGKRFLYLVESLIGFPRHLSQHTGGMVMTQGLLCELCPIENASMEGRTVIQWDKDDLDALGILKVDCLALGMLTAIHKSFDLIESHYARSLTLANVPQGDQSVYDMICKADTLGVFQIESRAQMSMLPRLKPRCFYDLVIEVAIVRPGPIQGQMVHPYLTARATGIQPEYPTPEIGQVLSKTLGVPIFQEQAMRLAVVAAGFTPGEADQLRRAMAAWRRPGVIDQFKQKLMTGMQKRGLSDHFAENVFTQLRGFGEYGFPESHAASFALLVYVSCWLKHHYPQVFCTAMLNSQPLGFYSPSQLVQCARNHHVQCFPADVNQSDWDCTLEKDTNAGSQSIPHNVRLGLRMISGLSESIARTIVEQRKIAGPYRDTNDLSIRTRAGSSVIALLAASGAIDSISGNRRAAYWQSLGLERSGKELPLFEQSSTNDDDLVPESLRPMTDIEEVYSDYSTTGLSLRGHPIGFCREKLNRLRVTPANMLASIASGKFIRVAGLIVLRQRPGTAKGITFVTLEDETGSINLIIKPTIWKQFYLVCKQSNAWLVHGVLESRQNVIHVVAGRIEDLSQEISGFDVDSRDFR